MVLNGKSKIAVFDIDGCCIDSSARWIASEGDHAKYEQLWRMDTPIEAGVEVYSALMKAGIHGLFLTARQYTQKVSTKQQLGNLFPDLDYSLLMSPELQEDHALFKANALFRWVTQRGLSLDNVLICFDDHTEVIDSYRNLGLTAYHTAKGWA